MTLYWPVSVETELKAWAEKCYPYEGCAVLVGRFGHGTSKRVERVVPIPNILHERQKDAATSLEGSAAGERPASFVLETASATLGKRVNSGGEFEFVMDPKEFNRVALDAEKNGWDVVGILHTHPDHPAMPSATDSAQPCLAVWSNVIVKVDQGKFVEARSWVRQEEDQPFQEEKIAND